MALDRIGERGPITILTFESLIADPFGAAALMAKVFRDFGELDIARAAQAVRQRSTACEDAMELDTRVYMARLTNPGRFG